MDHDKAGERQTIASNHPVMIRAYPVAAQWRQSPTPFLL